MRDACWIAPRMIDLELATKRAMEEKLRMGIFSMADLRQGLAEVTRPLRRAIEDELIPPAPGASHGKHRG